MSRRTALPTTLATNANDSRAYALFVVSGLLFVFYPGAVLGVGIALCLWRITRPPIAERWLVAALAAAGAALFGQPTNLAKLAPQTMIAALPEQMLLGPVLLLALQLGAHYRRQTTHGEEWGRHKRVNADKRALERGWQGPHGNASVPKQLDRKNGFIPLGIATDAQPFDLSPADIAHHVFVPGASGSGKTTTLCRLADGALQNGYAAIIIDCKGVGLGGTARALASRHNVPCTILDPEAADSVGYDPCSGTPAAIANKLIGAFSFSGEAEIYKHVAMEVVPVVCRAMDAVGQEITLDSVYDTLGKGGLARLGRTSGAEQYRDRLENLEASGSLGTAGYLGLQKRLGALMEGTFGETFRKRPTLDWRQQAASQTVTYLSLSSTAASEDVELFGRVITQDLKQLCDARMRALEAGEEVVPLLVIYDEFAALREAHQVIDLLLQARQARVAIVVATQYLPEDVNLRKPVLSAGLLIAHRTEANDAEAIAAQFGTHRTTNITNQMNFETGQSEKGSVRWVEEYDMHPNLLKDLPVGAAAVLARATDRKTLVRIAPI